METDNPSLVEVENLRAGYVADDDAIAGLSFAVQSGQRVGVLGPNGGGKTTLFNVLTGALRPRSGVVFAERCGLVPQTDRSRLDFPVSALDVAAMGALSQLPWWRRPGSHEHRRARAALERVGLDDLEHRTFGQLSGGQRQRALIARALVQDAPVLLLDEPFTGLDEPSAASLDRLIADLAAEQRSVLIATHDIAQARSWERVLCLNRRQIAYGEPEATLTREAVEQTYGGDVIQLPDGGAVIAPPHHH